MGHFEFAQSFEEYRPIIVILAGFLVPTILSPLIIMIERPLFALFQKESADLFLQQEWPKSRCRSMGHYVALFNIITFLFTWYACYGCYLLKAPFCWMLISAVGGVLVALFITVRFVHNFMELSMKESLIIGSMTFAGGNIPLIILVPLVWALS